MCVVSMIADHYNDKWRTQPIITQPAITWSPTDAPSRAEFDQLKRDVEEMKELLRKAKIYDEVNGEPDCEMAEKMALLRRVAEAVGVNLDDVIGERVP